MVNISDFSVISGFKIPRPCIINFICINQIIHPLYLFIHLIRARASSYWILHPIRVIHPVIGYRRSTRRGRANKGNKSEIRPAVLPVYLFDCFSCCKAFHSILSRHWTHLRDKIHIGPFSVQLFQMCIPGMLLHDERCISVLLFDPWGVIHLFCVNLHFIAQIFVDIRTCVEFSNAPSPISQFSHSPSKILTAIALHSHLPVTMDGGRIFITVAAYIVRFPSRPDNISCRNADRTRGICIRISNTSFCQPVQIGCLYHPISQCTNAVKPELITHNI